MPRIPDGNGDVVVIVSAVRICSEKLFCAMTWGVLLSLTWTVKFDVPVPVGVPPIVPEVNVRPAGREPLVILQE